MNLKELEAELGTLTVFGGVEADEVFSEFRSMLSMLEQKQESRTKASSFAWQLYGLPVLDSTPLITSHSVRTWYILSIANPYLTTQASMILFQSK